MSLPGSTRDTLTVELSGGPVEVTGLLIGQVRVIRKMPADEGDVHAIMWGTGATMEEAKDWFAQASAGDAVKLLDAIQRASGMDTGATFPAATGDDDGAQRPGA